jgi:hypothetical protein
MKAFSVMQSCAIVVAEHLFVEDTRTDETARRLRKSLSIREQAPKVFQSICVHLPIDVAFRMVNRVLWTKS